MRRILGVFGALLVAVACSSGSGRGAGGGDVCAKGRQKANACGFHNLANKGECDGQSDPEDACYVNCSLALPCSAWVAAYCHQDYSGFLGCLDQCEPAPFICGDGEEVSNDSKCDGYEDCSDGSDEAGCPTFDCGDGNTYVQSMKCDGFTSCSTGTDEVGCPGSITCGDGSTVGEFDHCDGIDQCPGGEDEAGCVFVTCGDGTTYPPDYRCDGFEDCSDGSDEAGCPGSGGGGGADPLELIALDCQNLP